MIALLATGLFSFLQPAAPKPTCQPPNWPKVESKPLTVTKPGVTDLQGKIFVMGKIPPVVKEYGTPSLHIFTDKATLRNFAWRGSMEGLHVGSQPFSGPNMRNPHKPIRVTLEKLFCDDIGEDCVSIQPRARVTLRDSVFRGNYKRTKGGGDTPGMDKITQIDGADVLIENCDFFNGMTAIRAKANSTVTIRNCRFIDCSICICGDGGDNPRSGHTFDNGKAGPCKIIVENCEAWNCGEVARAFKGCEIELRGVKTHRVSRRAHDLGGRIIDK